MVGALVSESFYNDYSTFATCFACTANAFLIYAIVVSNVKHVGPYRFLLLAFAVVEILISLVHFALIPCIHLTESGVIFWGYRVLQLPTEQGVWADMLWLILFYQTFVLTAFHYVYRFVLVCDPPWLSWIQRNPWRNSIAIALVYDIFFIGSLAASCYSTFHPDFYRQALAPVMMEVYNIDLLAPNKPGFMGVLYWTRRADGSKEWAVRSIASLSIIVIVFSTSVFVLLYCLIRTLRALTSNIIQLNSVVRNVQKQLFRALLWQTIIPLFTSYLPIAFLFLAPPLTGIAFGGIGTVALMSTQFFPIIDPFIVLFFVQGYRAALPRFVKKLALKTYELAVSFSNASASVAEL